MAYDSRLLFNLIRDKLSRDVGSSLAGISTRTGVGRHTLERVIRRETGSSFRQYRQELLLKKALDLFSHEGQMSIKEIAASMGYNHAQAFSRFIKRTTRKSPKEHRGNRNGA